MVSTKGNKNVYVGRGVTMKLSLSIDDNGKPYQIQYKKHTCEDAKNEMERLLSSSPIWAEICLMDKNEAVFCTFCPLRQNFKVSRLIMDFYIMLFNSLTRFRLAPIIFRNSLRREYFCIKAFMYRYNHTGKIMAATITCHAASFLIL